MKKTCFVFMGMVILCAVFITGSQSLYAASYELVGPNSKTFTFNRALEVSQGKIFIDGTVVTWDSFDTANYPYMKYEERATLDHDEGIKVSFPENSELHYIRCAFIGQKHDEFIIPPGSTMIATFDRDASHKRFVTGFIVNKHFKNILVFDLEFTDPDGNVLEAFSTYKCTSAHVPVHRVWLTLDKLIFWESPEAI